MRADFKMVGWDDKPVEPAALQEAIDSFLDKATMTHCRQHMWAVMDGLIKKVPGTVERRTAWHGAGAVTCFSNWTRKCVLAKCRAWSTSVNTPPTADTCAAVCRGTRWRPPTTRCCSASTPGKVDWKIFQERSNYDSGKFGFYVHQPDLAVHLDITPERAKVVNDTIWEVVSGIHTPGYVASKRPPYAKEGTGVPSRSTQRPTGR